MPKRAPDTAAYWKAQTELLMQTNPTLYEDVLRYEFKWDGSSISYGKQLGARLALALGNVHGYANSTYVMAIKHAIHVKERELRKAAITKQPPSVINNRNPEDK